MTRRRDRIVTALAVVLVAAALTAAPAGAESADAPRAAWTPPQGAVFNDPTGGRTARAAIVTRIRQAIRHTPRGATIRIATYSFDRNDVADLLVRAYRRGVEVQVIANDNSVSPAEKRLQRLLGKRRGRPSFLVFCQGSCRNGPGGNLHTKIYSFSASGAATDVIISSSANLTYGAAFGQWNDAYTIHGDHDLFRTWIRVFDELKRDRRSRPRYLSYSSPDRSVVFQREAAGTTTLRSARAGSGDPAVRRLSKVGCRAPTGFGSGGRTVVKIIVFAWYGERGEAIARKVAGLRRQGCRVEVIGSVLGGTTGRILRRAGIPVKAADWDFGKRISSGDEDKIVYGPRCYSHYKFFTLNGAYDGAGARVVWTGSENWSRISFANDEVTLRLNGSGPYRRYAGRFDRMWRDPDATHAVGVEPGRRPCVRG